MNETLALIISGVSVAGGIGSFVFFHNKSKENLTEKTNKIDDLQISLEKLKNLSKDEILKVTDENKALKLENEQIKEQLNISQAEIFSLQEENELNLANMEKNLNQTTELNNVSEILNNLNSLDNFMQDEEGENVTVPLSILFVDDSPVIRVTMKKFLKDENVDLTLVNDGLEALNMLNEKRFDLVITDLEMPHLDGFGLMAKLSENNETKDIPVIVLTGHDDINVKIEEANSLMGLYKKPWNEVELLKRIKLLSHLNSKD